MSFVSVKGNSSVYAFNPAMASEERVVVLRAFYKGTSFEMNVSEEDAKVLTKQMPTEYIVDCLRRGKTLPGLKTYWIHELDKYHAIYSRLMENDPLKYLGEPMSVIIKDIYAESMKYEDSELDIAESEILNWFSYKWFVGVGCLTKMGVIDEEDDDNGFTFLSAPKSLMALYDKVMEVRTMAEREKVAGADPSEP
jgi:hypothetical protein